MATTLIPPPVETELPLSDDNIIGGGDGPREPELPATPLSVYGAITFWAIVSIVMLFSALTVIVRARWVGSDDWISVPLPHVLYWNTAILLVSSLTIELARISLRKKKSKDCIRWLVATLILGLAFLAGQIVAWRELVNEGLYLASNPGSFFIYVISGTHGLHLAGGIAALAFVAVFFNRWSQNAKQQVAVGVVAIYWHFMDGLWLYVLALLFVTIQR